jgi:hypothetical protein
VTVQWLTTFLAASPKWQEKCRNEVDLVVQRFRKCPEQPLAELFATLPIQVWQSEFPVLHSLFKKAFCLASSATLFRKNESGCDIAIGKSGLVVASGSYVSYLTDDMYLDSGHVQENSNDVNETDSYTYLDQLNCKYHLMAARFDANEFMVAEMKLAKVQTTLILSHLLRIFEFQLSDKEGRPTATEVYLSSEEHNLEELGRLMYMRYRRR